MTTKIAPPSRNPTDDNSAIGMFSVVLDKFLQGVDDMLPARVIAYNRTTNRAQVQPLIPIVTTLDEIVTRAQVASIPVLQLGGGGFILSFPLQTGDLGWIKANDRDISLFKKSYSNTPPNTKRKHSFEDAIFIPDTMMRMVTVNAEDVSHALLQNLDGTVRIAIWPNQLKLTTPNMGIGDTEGYTPDPNALLDVNSTTRAFRPPTMSSAQKEGISNPQIGFTVYDTDKPGLSSYDGATWD